MRNIFNAASIALFTLMFLKQSVLAADIPLQLLEKSLPATNKFIESVRWPKESEKLGFKSLSIGDSFNLEDIQFVHAYVGEQGSVSHKNPPDPFLCKGEVPVPLFNCKLLLWNGGGAYPKKLQEMQYAFGDHVGVEFSVLLQRAIGQTEISTKKYGSGRIASITIINNRPNNDFVKKATSYFSEKLNSQPVVRTTYKNPTEIYSKKCIETTRRIENKAISELSLKDKNELKSCESEAALAVLSGKARSGRQTVYTWEPFEGKTEVIITSSESTLSIGGGMPNIPSNSVTILIDLNVKDAVATWLEDWNKIRSEYVAESRNIAIPFKINNTQHV